VKRKKTNGVSEKIKVRSKKILRVRNEAEAGCLMSDEVKQRLKSKREKSKAQGIML
jgi:hypothetical protein